jgi:hypothetical protein
VTLLVGAAVRWMVNEPVPGTALDTATFPAACWRVARMGASQRRDRGGGQSGRAGCWHAVTWGTCRDHTGTPLWRGC